MDLSGKMSRTSWHFWFYKHVYDAYYVPHNLCPYFWRLVGGFFIALVLTPIFVPYILYKLVKEGKWVHYTEEFGISCGVSVLSFVSTCMVWMWWRTWPKGKDSADWIIIFGFIGYSALIVLTIFLLAEKRRERRSERRAAEVQKRLDAGEDYWDVIGSYGKKPRRWLIIEYIKSVYHKHCPSIEWEN